MKVIIGGIKGASVDGKRVTVAEAIFVNPDGTVSLNIDIPFNVGAATGLVDVMKTIYVAVLSWAKNNSFTVAQTDIWNPLANGLTVPTVIVP